MNIPLISKLVDQCGFKLMFWNDRYCKGVWAVCLPGAGQVDAVNDSSEGGDLDMIPATAYLLDSTWLPVVTGDNFVDALAKLESRLATLDPDQVQKKSDWGTAVYEALEHLMEVKRTSKRYGGTDGKFRALPEDFALIARAVDRQREDGGDVVW